ncbi:uncharacterized protein DUF4241 [Sediminihabitans luteus]|uniref:Uncharacterized protein DUF4241 n=1 Tax=Sediminihabitans luteus TaxID=1138585 RepID=A0A2M9CQC7_9CELL|nr:DUF4241 domain-containing protein [Sediminihabitans luteus]PJJ74097.1 uncharacterized protein DUF4241 [Sediminihabitans luteus]GII97988.1 hypothetical protein Slu03_03660 [Sediminihabitans luteus]
MTTLETFAALREGDATPSPYRLSVHDLGEVHVPSGRLEAVDPYVFLGGGAVIRVPAGSHPVRVTVADVSPAQDGSHLREAYLSVVLAEGEVERVAPPHSAERLDGPGYVGVPVDAGVVAFVDADATAAAAPDDTWYDEHFDSGRDDSWFARQDDPEHVRPGCANVPLPGVEGANVVMAHAGWGDGFYPVRATYAADGTMLGVHIDLHVAVAAGADPAADDGAAA